MIYTLAGIVVICAFLCFVELIVRILEAVERRKRQERKYKTGRVIRHEVYRRTRA